MNIKIYHRDKLVSEAPFEAPSNEWANIAWIIKGFTKDGCSFELYYRSEEEYKLYHNWMLKIMYKEGAELDTVDY